MYFKKKVFDFSYVTNAKSFNGNLKSWIHTSRSRIFHQYPIILQYYDYVYIVST